MLVFISDRKYSMALLHSIFDKFVSGQIEFYLNSEDAVVLFFPVNIKEEGIEFPNDASSYNLFSALYARYVSLLNPYKGIEMRVRYGGQ